MPFYGAFPTQEITKKTLAWYAVQWVGRPYIWGGDDHAGFDCSGFNIELQILGGTINRGEDFTADGLFRRHLERGQVVDPEDREAGDFVYWFNDAGRAVHTAILGHREVIIHAGGGGSPSRRPEDVIAGNTAFEELIFKDSLGYLREIYDAGRQPEDYARTEVCLIGAREMVKENPDLAWILKRYIYHREAIERNAYIRADRLGYRGLNFKICDAFKQA